MPSRSEMPCSRLDKWQNCCRDQHITRVMGVNGDMDAPGPYPHLEHVIRAEREAKLNQCSPPIMPSGMHQGISFVRILYRKIISACVSSCLNSSIQPCTRQFNSVLGQQHYVCHLAVDTGVQQSSCSAATQRLNFGIIKKVAQNGFRQSQE